MNATLSGGSAKRLSSNSEFIGMPTVLNCLNTLDDTGNLVTSFVSSATMRKHVPRLNPVFALLSPFLRGATEIHGISLAL